MHRIRRKCVVRRVARGTMLRELNKARAGFCVRDNAAAAAFLGASDDRPAAVATGNWCAAGP